MKKIALFFLLLALFVFPTMASHAANLVLNGSFEEDTVPGFPGYGPITSWNNGSGINDKSGPFWDNGFKVNGEKIGFKQGSGIMYQDVDGFVSGAQYTLRFIENMRNCCDGPAVDLVVRVGGTEVVAQHTITVGEFLPVSVDFTSPGDGVFQLEFEVIVTSDATLLLDAVSICPKGEEDPFPLNPFSYVGTVKALFPILPSAPTVDGTMDAGYAASIWYRCSDTWNTTLPESEADFSAGFRGGFIGKNIYLLFDVTDDVVGLEGIFWEPDSVEVFFDFSNSGESVSGMDDATYQANWNSVGGPSQFRFVADGTTKNYGNGTIDITTEADFAVLQDTASRTYEVKINVPDTVTFTENMSFAFGVHVVDNDGPAYKTSIGWFGSEAQTGNTYLNTQYKPHNGSWAEAVLTTGTSGIEHWMVY